MPPIVRPSRARDYRNHFRTYILPYLADVALQTSRSYISKNSGRAYKSTVIWGLKTVRNVIDGSLRAMVRDARKAGVQAGFPFADFSSGPDELYRVLIHSRTRSGTDCSNSFFASIGVLGEILVPIAKGFTSPIRVSLHALLYGFVPPKLWRFASGLSIWQPAPCWSSGRAHAKRICPQDFGCGSRCLDSPLETSKS